QVYIRRRKSSRRNIRCKNNERKRMIKWKIDSLKSRKDAKRESNVANDSLQAENIPRRESKSSRDSVGREKNRKRESNVANDSLQAEKIPKRESKSAKKSV